MLKQFAPIAVMPPSPKSRAWMPRANDNATMDAHGPSSTAATPTPTACPVVPPGSGMLNIITTNEKAARSESTGTRRVWTCLRTRRIATYQKGAEVAYSAAQVAGALGASGWCLPDEVRARLSTVSQLPHRYPRAMEADMAQRRDAAVKR